MTITVTAAARYAAKTMQRVQTANPSRLTKAAQQQRAELAKLEKPYFFSTENGRRILWGYDLRQRWTPCGRGLFEIVTIPIYGQRVFSK